MITRENLLETVRNNIILFCRTYLDKHPSPGFFYNQQELVRECIKTVTEIPESNSYDLAMTLFKIKNKVIAHEKKKINITPGMFFTTERGEIGRFRLALENSIRTLIDRPSYEREVEIDIDGATRPQEMTEMNIGCHFNIELNTIRPG